MVAWLSFSEAEEREAVIVQVVRAVAEANPFATLPSGEEMLRLARRGAEAALAEGAPKDIGVALAARLEVEAALWSGRGVVIGPCG